MKRLIPLALLAALAGCIPGYESPRAMLVYDIGGVVMDAQQEYYWPEMVRTNGVWARSGRELPAVVVRGPRSFDTAVRALMLYCGWYERPRGLTAASVYYHEPTRAFWFSGVLCE